MKELLLARSVPLLGYYFRHAPAGFLSTFLWKRFCERFVNWRGIERTATTSFGMKLRCTTRDLIQSYLIYFRVWEPNLTAFVQKRLSPGRVFIDVGANVGYFSLLASQQVGATGGVVAIEASPQNHAQLEGNLLLNGCTNVRTINAAAMDRECEVELFSPGVWNTGGVSLVRARERIHEARVPAHPLHTIPTESELRRSRLVKIDVEGAELMVLRDILATLDMYPEDVEFVVEISPQAIADMGSSAEDVLHSFEEHGFHAYRLHNDYRAESYLRPQGIAPPTRVTETPREQVDIVFSRCDTATL